MTADAPATVAGRTGPDLPTRQATPRSISARSPAEVFGALESSPQGLAAAKAASRLAALGPNELRAAKRPPVIKKVLAQFTNLFALVLLAASVITFASYLIQSPRDTGSLELAVAILAVVVLNGFGLALLLADEGRKTVVRHRRSRLPGQAPWPVREKGV